MLLNLCRGLNYFLEDSTPTLHLPSYPVFAFAHLMDPELLSAGTLGHLLLHFVVYPLGIGQRSLALPVGSECGDELLVVDVAILVAIENVSHCAHLQAAGWELWKFENTGH